MAAPPEETAELLANLHSGDERALVQLMERDLPWVRALVSRRLGPLLRRQLETQDLVQEAFVGVLRDGPRFVVRDKRNFRGLVARIVENLLRRKHEHLTADRRDPRREDPLRDGDSILQLDQLPAAVTGPTQAAERNEVRSWIRLALELLNAEDRQLIVEREYQSMSFAVIGTRLGVSEDAARMRFQRALGRLGKALAELRAGRLGELLGDLDSPRDSEAP